MSEGRRTPAGILLAAGHAKRMGAPKALMHIEGRTVLERLCDVYVAAPLAPVIVAASGATLTVATEREDIEVVRGDPDTQMIDSLALALDAIPDDAPGVIVQPIDAPFTTGEMIASLLGGDPNVSRVLTHRARPGHPVYLARALFSMVQDRPEGGLRRILAEHDVNLVEWEDDRILADLDTPQDLQTWVPGALH